MRYNETNEARTKTYGPILRNFRHFANCGNFWANGFSGFARKCGFRAFRGGINLKLGQEYEDEGITATLFGQDLGKNVETSSDLDVNKIGTYHVDYFMTFWWKEFNASREIIIYDDTPPEISLNGDAEAKLYVGDEYEEEGATASDNYDGDLTEKIETHGEVDTSKAGSYQITYVVKDSSGNESSATRTVTVQKRPEVAKVDTNVKYDITSDALTQYIKNKGYQVAVGYYNLATGRSYYYQENKIYYGASLIKTLDADYLYDNNKVTDEAKSYLKKAISVSDNAAHLWLVDYIGRDNLKQYGASIGAKNTLTTTGNYGDTSVMDQMAYWKKLYSLSAKNTELRSFFINNYYNYIRISGLTTMHKYGYADECFHDVGIVFDSQPYIVVILTSHGWGAGGTVIQDLTTMIYKFHKSA